MPKVVSNEQRLANRRNAQQSTGPKTPDGRDLGVGLLRQIMRDANLTIEDFS